MRTALNKIVGYCGGRKRFWIPLLCGLGYSLCLPPFSSLLHPALTPMPFLAFAALIPFFFFATRTPRRRAFIYTYIYCAAMVLGQHYWIGFVTAEGFWALVLIGVALISLVWGALYFAAALLFRLCMRKLPRMYIIVYPAVWVLVEYSRTLTDLAFPWSYLGYSAVGLLPLAQFSSFTGVWGLSYIIVLGNVVIWELLRAYKANVSSGDNSPLRQKWLIFGIWAALVTGIFVWGGFRMNTEPPAGETARVALMQTYMDQFNWGRNSLDTAVTISDSMITAVAKETPDFIIFAESALLCYLSRRTDIKQSVFLWEQYTGVPILLGSLHWERSADAAVGDRDKFDVYNTAFLVKDGQLIPYHKILLVPFSEIMPFEAQFPIISRINLGGAGFKRGQSESIFRVSGKLEIAPYICYEIIFPSFVRRRLQESTNLLVNITNDGWFGRSSGPYQHAAMAQMRSIENGITLARAANSGISMHVDPYGRILSRTRLYTRDIVVDDIPTYRIMTYYTRYGDWFVALCAALVMAGIITAVTPKKRLGEITNPLLVEEQKPIPAGACRSECV